MSVEGGNIRVIDTPFIDAVPAAPKISDLLIYRDSYLVDFMGKRISFSRKEFGLLCLLASRPERVFTREEIWKKVWALEIKEMKGRTIDVHIRLLRKKLSDEVIVTVKGVGYKLSSFRATT